MLQDLNEDDIKDALLELLKEEKIIALCPKCNTLLSRSQVEMEVCGDCSSINFNDIRIYARDTLSQA